MALSDEKREAAGAIFFKCPSCGKRYDLNRTYCDCHTRLESVVYWTDDEDVAIGGAVNVEFADITCADCGAGCKFCYSFSTLKANHRGFGGTDCVQKQSSLRCSCCQTIMKNGSFDGKNIRGLVEGVNAMWSKRGA
jgi:hypothetical protein